MLQGFDHVNVRTANLDEMARWYADILGLHAGARPGFSFPGAWLYLNDLALVHLVGVDTQPENRDPQIEHIALRATGYAAFLEKLKDRQIAYALSEVRDAGVVQVNIFDPDGNHIHVDFDLEEREPG